jgi:hypothetical protein
MRRALVLLTVLGCGGAMQNWPDPVLDQRVTELDGRMEGFLDAMERAAGTSAGSYRANSPFYAQVKGDLEGLRHRASLRPRASEMVAAISEVYEQVENLRKAHEGGADSGLNRVVTMQMRPFLKEKIEVLYRKTAPRN